MTKPRMRTRDKCIELLRQEDPDTAVTRSSIDYLIQTGRLPFVDIGNKILINYDLLLETLAKGMDAPEQAQEATTGTIRKIEI
jgi:hypothetical protein